MWSIMCACVFFCVRVVAFGCYFLCYLWCVHAHGGDTCVYSRALAKIAHVLDVDLSTVTVFPGLHQVARRL